MVAALELYATLLCVMVFGDAWAKAASGRITIKRCLRLDLQWVPRDQNEEADGLTNLDFSSFDPGRRMDLKIADLRFEVLDAYMAAATALYDDVARMRSAGAGAASRTGAACLNPGLAAASTKPWAKAAPSRTGAPMGGGPSPGLAAASTKSWAEAAPSQPGAGAAEPAAGGLRHPRPRRKKLKEVAPW